MRRWAIACVAGAAVLLSACQVNLETRIEASGAGSLTIEVGLTPDDASQLQSFSSGGSGGSICRSLNVQAQGQTELPAFQEEKRGEDTWCVSTQAFEDLSGLEALYRQMDGVTIRELVLREGVFVYDIDVDAGGLDGVPGLATVSWIVELPGKIGDHNADRADGQRLTWNLVPGERRSLHASSDLYGLRLPAGWDDALGRLPAIFGAGIACLCCGGVLVVVIVGLVLLLRRKT